MGSFTKFEDKEIENKIKLAENVELLNIEKGKMSDEHNHDKKIKNPLVPNRKLSRRKFPAEPGSPSKSKEKQFSFNQSSPSFKNIDLTSTQKDFELKQVKSAAKSPDVIKIRESNI